MCGLHMKQYLKNFIDLNTVLFKSKNTAYYVFIKKATMEKLV